MSKKTAWSINTEQDPEKTIRVQRTPRPETARPQTARPKTARPQTAKLTTLKHQDWKDFSDKYSKC